MLTNKDDFRKMRVKIRVIPRAKKEKVEEFAGGLKVYVREPALENRANKRLIKVLADYFDVKKQSIKIIMGEAGREKVVDIREAD